jgi:hypothetical protein
MELSADPETINSDFADERMERIRQDQSTSIQGDGMILLMIKL